MVGFLSAKNHFFIPQNHVLSRLLLKDRVHVCGDIPFGIHVCVFE